MIDYASPGHFTALDSMDSWLFEGLQPDPVGACQPVAALIIQPSDAEALALPSARFEENQLRPAKEIVTRLVELGRVP